MTSPPDISRRGATLELKCLCESGPQRPCEATAPAAAAHGVLQPGNETSDCRHRAKDLVLACGHLLIALNALFIALKACELEGNSQQGPPAP